MGALPEDYRATLIAVLAVWQDMTGACVRAAQAACDIYAHQDPCALAALFWTGWERASLRAKFERHPAPLRKLSAGFVRLI